MARISGIDLPREKRIEIGLTYIYGIGRPTADKILKETGVSPDTRVRDLTEQQEGLLRDYIDKNLEVEGDLRRDVQLNIKRLMEIGCYRGIPPPPWTARARTEHQAERPYPQRPQTDRCR